MKRTLFFVCIAALLVCVPVLIVTLHLEVPERWTDETVLRTVLGVVLFGLVPSGIPAVLLTLLLVWKRVATPADLSRNKPVLFALLGALISVYAVHWWTFSDAVEFGLLVHALAVPFFGVIALAIGFGMGSILQK